MLRRAALAIEAIESALASHSDDPFPASDWHPQLNDCEFPDCVADPLELIRHALGEERARMHEYHDDLECILCDLEDCMQRELHAQGKTPWDVQGDASGEESDHGEGVEGPPGELHCAPRDRDRTAE